MLLGVEKERRLSVIIRSIILIFKSFGNYFLIDEMLRTKCSYFLGIEKNKHSILSVYFTGYAESIIGICTDKTCAIEFPKTILIND